MKGYKDRSACEVKRSKHQYRCFLSCNVAVGLSGTHKKKLVLKRKPNKEDKGTQTENSKVENVVHKSQYGIMPLVHNAKTPIIKNGKHNRQ